MTAPLSFLLSFLSSFTDLYQFFAAFYWLFYKPNIVSELSILSATSSKKCFLRPVGLSIKCLQIIHIKYPYLFLCKPWQGFLQLLKIPVPLYYISIIPLCIRYSQPLFHFYLGKSFLITLSCLQYVIKMFIILPISSQRTFCIFQVCSCEYCTYYPCSEKNRHLYQPAS